MPEAKGYGAAAEFLAARFGGPVEEFELTPATTTTPAAVTGNDPEVVMRLLINLGVNPVFIALTAQVSASRGILLAANGGGVVLSVEEDGTLPGREWWAVSPAGASQLYVLTVRRSSRAG